MGFNFNHFFFNIIFDKIIEISCNDRNEQHMVIIIFFVYEVLVNLYE